MCFYVRCVVRVTQESVNYEHIIISMFAISDREKIAIGSRSLVRALKFWQRFQRNKRQKKKTRKNTNFVSALLSVLDSSASQPPIPTYIYIDWFAIALPPVPIRSIAKRIDLHDFHFLCDKRPGQHIRLFLIHRSTRLCLRTTSRQSDNHQSSIESTRRCRERENSIELIAGS